MSEFITEITEAANDPLGGASGKKRMFDVRFMGKTNNADFPYTVANEIVASVLGTVLGLNVPHVIAHSIGGEECVLIHMKDRDPRMQQKAPASARALSEYVQSNPWEVHGAIIFDLFLANNDRAFGPQRRNLLIDSSGKLLLYDNGNCCFYRNRPKASIVAGVARLNAVENDLSAMFDMDSKGNHYRQFLTDQNLVEEWCGRLAQLPGFLIEAAVDQIPPGAATDAERGRLAEFLLRRRHDLRGQIASNRAMFPGLAQ